MIDIKDLSTTDFLKYQVIWFLANSHIQMNLSKYWVLHGNTHTNGLSCTQLYVVLLSMGRIYISCQLLGRGYWHSAALLRLCVLVVMMPYMTLSLWVEEKLVGKNNGDSIRLTKETPSYTHAHKRLTINSRWHLQQLPFEYWCVRCGGKICEIKEILLSWELWIGRGGVIEFLVSLCLLITF